MTTVRLTPGYFRTARRLAPSGSSTAFKLAACLRTLGDEPVPAPADEEDLVPPVVKCWARRVPTTALVVLFDRRGDDVIVLAVKIAG